MIIKIFKTLIVIEAFMNFINMTAAKNEQDFGDMVYNGIRLLFWTLILSNW